MDSWNNC